MSLIAGNLAVVQKLLDAEGLSWGVHGGAAAHFYGTRRPLQDIDILLPPGTLNQVSIMLQRGQKTVQFDGGRILWRGVVLMDDFTVRQNGVVYPFVLDDLLIERLQRKPLLGARVLFVPPEDVLVYKLFLNRGAELNKFDAPDAAGIIKRQTLDMAYLRQRIERSNTAQTVIPRLAEHGIVL